MCLMGILVCWLGDDCYCDFGYCKDMNPLSVQGLVVLLKNQLVGLRLSWTID